MEKVIPKCQCGADVMYDYMYEPMYDEDGSLICHRPTDVVFNDVCHDCFIAQQSEGRVVITHDDEDELPF